MKTQQTTFETLPQQVDNLMSEILEIKRILLERKEKPTVLQQYLGSKEALSELKAMGYSISWSKFTKMVASRTIPCHKLDNKLLFNREDLQNWFNNRMNQPEKDDGMSKLSVINSARSKQR
jgi:hypothetical protein